MTDTSPDPKPYGVEWLRELCDKAGKGVLDNIDARGVRRTIDGLMDTITTLRASLGEAEKRADHNDAGWNTALEVAAKWSAKATDANGTADALVSIVQGWRERAEKAESALSASEGLVAVLREALEPFAKAGELVTSVSFLEDSRVVYTPVIDANYCITAGDLRAATKALSTTPATLSAPQEERRKDHKKLTEDGSMYWSGGGCRWQQNRRAAEISPLAAPLSHTFAQSAAAPATRTLGRTPGTNEVCSLCKVPFMGPEKGCGAGVPYHVCPMMRREGGEK